MLPDQAAGPGRPHAEQAAHRQEDLREYPAPAGQPRRPSSAAPREDRHPARADRPGPCGLTLQIPAKREMPPAERAGSRKRHHPGRLHASREVLMKAASDASMIALGSHGAGGFTRRLMDRSPAGEA